MISCFMTSFGKKYVIQFTNATHKSFAVNSLVATRFKWDRASARVKVVSTVALSNVSASGISESREQISVRNESSLRPSGTFDAAKSYRSS